MQKVLSDINNELAKNKNSLRIVNEDITELIKLKQKELDKKFENVTGDIWEAGRGA